MKTLYMLIGLPGSGKSTWAEKKYKEDGMILWLSTDHYIEQFAVLAGKTYTEVFKSKISEATDFFFEDVKDFASAGLDMIIDRTNMTISSRKRILNLIPSTYYKEAIIFKCDEKLLIERLNSRPGKFIPIEAINSMRDNFQYIEDIEGFNKVTEIVS